MRRWLVAGLIGSLFVVGLIGVIAVLARWPLLMMAALVLALTWAVAHVAHDVLWGDR